MNIKVDRAFMPSIGKTVSARFWQMCPDSVTFSKKRITHFYENDKECIKKLVQEEYVKYELRKMDNDCQQSLPENPNTAVTNVEKSATYLHTTSSVFSQEYTGAAYTNTIAFS